MAPAGKVSSFYREGTEWFCTAGLPSDITVTVEGINFHLHKFPLIIKCGKIAKLYEEEKEEGSQTTQEKIFKPILLEFPGGPNTFLITVKFCYGIRIQLTPENIVPLYCAADYLEMTHDLGEHNLLPICENFFRQNILRNWKDSILALQTYSNLTTQADKLQIVTKCLNTLSMMVSMDPSLIGGPTMVCGSLQSPDGSILWNGINTGARIRIEESDWWFEDVSNLSLTLFERLIKIMKGQGVRQDSLVNAIMYYARKYLPGLDRWQVDPTGKPRAIMAVKAVTHFSLTSSGVDQRVILESVEKLISQEKSKPFCRFLLGLLRVGLILGVDQRCVDSLERKIGMQLELASLDGLLIPTYMNLDALYNTDSVERIMNHFVSLVPNDLEKSPISGPVQKVSRLMDSYIAEVASDVNLKPGKVRALIEALPESSRTFHDGIYRALDIYFKAHPWLSEKEREELCSVINYQKLSIDACAHASQNERLPLRIVLQVLFFEQMHLRAALAGCLRSLDRHENVFVGPMFADRTNTSSLDPIVHQDGRVSVVQENQDLKVDMEKMRLRVGELEDEFSKIKEEMKNVKEKSSSHCLSSSPRLVAWRNGRKTQAPVSDDQLDTIKSIKSTPRASIDQQAGPRTSLDLGPGPSSRSGHRKTLSVS